MVMPLLLLACLSPPAVVDAGSLDRLLEDVRAASFPELRDSPLTIERFRSDTVFFMSNVDVASAFDDDGPLVLQVFINDAVLQDGPGEDALRAVLAHELAHSLDYVQRDAAEGPRGLLALLPMLVWPPAEEVVERRTDLVAVRRGYGVGLAAYRQWLYRRLPADAVLEKRRVYYSPLELLLLQRLQTRCPDALDAALEHPPTTAAAIARLAPAGCFG